MRYTHRCTDTEQNLVTEKITNSRNLGAPTDAPLEEYLSQAYL